MAVWKFEIEVEDNGPAVKDNWEEVELTVQDVMQEIKEAFNTTDLTLNQIKQKEN